MGDRRRRGLSLRSRPRRGRRALAAPRVNATDSASTRRRPSEDRAGVRARYARHWRRVTSTTASATLGRPFVLRGSVEHGDTRGEELGFATANVATAPFQLLPREGIYAGAARTTGPTVAACRDLDRHATAVLRGRRTAGRSALPGYKVTSTASSLDVAFLDRLRGQEVFADVDALVAQIGRDVEQTLEIFKLHRRPMSALLE